MDRRLMADLVRWKESPTRKPLMLEGVRQSGKTWLLKRFGEECFPGTAYFNFEDTPRLAAIFEQDLDPARILKELSLLAGLPLLEGNCFVVLDEVQLCGKALTSLKYFQEKIPGYPIAVAGSLLGVQMARPTSYPVGKVDILTLRPLDFDEFLRAAGEKGLCEFLSTVRLGERVPEVVDSRLGNLVTSYLICGGMPEAVKTWLSTSDEEKTNQVLGGLLALYESDFLKHAPKTEIPKVGMVWASIPAHLSKPHGRFLFKEISDGARAREFENALQWLCNAGMVHRVQRVEKPALPLMAYADRSFFKLFCHDVGVLRRMAHLPASAILGRAGAFQEFKGALWENFFLQEHIAHTDEPAHYWQSGNSAEIDFLVQSGTRIVPVEIKSADNVKSKSLGVYREKYYPEICVRVSRKNFGFENGILSLPPYMISRLRDLTLPSG